MVSSLENTTRIRGLGAPTLLWISDVAGFEVWARTQNELSLSRPDSIMSAAPPALLASWAEKNPWATSIPLIPWHCNDGDDRPPPPFYQRFMPAGDGPYAVLARNAKMAYRDAHGTDRIDAVIRAAHQVTAAHTTPLGRVWELYAPRTWGLLALGAALANGKAVAVAERPGDAPTPYLLAACRNFGVVLRVVQTAADVSTFDV